MTARIYLSPPHMGPDERALLCDAFDSNWIAPLGPHVDGFERDMCALTGAPHAVALSSGTAALELALRVLGIGPGDVVLISSLTFAATANAVVHVGAEPVFVDSERTSWNLDPARLEEALLAEATRGDGKRVRALITVDLYGQCADYDRISAICERHGVEIIEDAAEALGATHRGRSAGTLGALGVFSFNGNKIITTSGGGMLVGRKAEHIAHARHLATQARMPAPHYEHEEVGFNYRMSNLLAAIGRGQLRVLPERVARRRAINAHYRRLLGDLPGLAFMPEAAWGTSTFWLTTLTVDPARFGADRERIRLALEAANIEARPVWKPMHLQPVYRDRRAYGGEVSADLFERGLCLPSGSSLSDADVERVAGLVRDCQRQGAAP